MKKLSLLLSFVLLICVIYNMNSKCQHIRIVDAAVAPTCASEGKTEGERCSTCGEIFVTQETINKLEHTPITDSAIAPTCTSEGKTEGVHCSVCGEVLVVQNTISKLEHTPVVDAAVSPSCLTRGKTEGQHCLICGEVLVNQESIKWLDHSYGEWTVLKKSTKTKEGERVHTCTRCGNVEYKSIDTIRYDGSLGSTGKLSDPTVIVSVFANDKDTNWDFDSDIDIETINTMHEHLESAVNWITQQCIAYGVKAEFTYDWKKYPDLFYTFDFPLHSMVNSDASYYKIQRTRIKTRIESDELKQKYNAQNIIYVLYFNTDESNTVRSKIMFREQPYGDVEIINAFVRRGDSYVFPAASCAHEILHGFGAKDFYEASEAIPQEYVDYCELTNSRDIMFVTNIGKRIETVFSELDAYYVGLIDNCDEVEKFGLAPSIHSNS